MISFFCPHLHLIYAKTMLTIYLYIIIKGLDLCDLGKLVWEFRPTIFVLILHQRDQTNKDNSITVYFENGVSRHEMQ